MSFVLCCGEFDRQALALLTGSPGKGGLTQRDTFTIPPKEGASSGSYLPTTTIATARLRVKLWLAGLWLAGLWLAGLGRSR
jgi:hypothetical protein